MEPPGARFARRSVPFRRSFEAFFDSVMGAGGRKICALWEKLEARI
jgi:hypothetical protein